jgi:putative ABC transport system ATP-binding protein
MNLQDMHHDYKETTVGHAGLSITHRKIDITERVFLHGNSGSGENHTFKFIVWHFNTNVWQR